MRILIITIHRPANCGSALQAFALDRYLHEKGYDAALIDYIPRYLETEGSAARAFLRKLLFYRPYKRRQENFRAFIDTQCHLTSQKYGDYEELERNPPQADVYLAGSDQLWNPCFNCGRDAAYYLEFVKDGIKMSYATSLGNDRMSEEELNFVSSKIQNFDYLSVRERCSVEQLKLHGIENVKWVCDPTLLLERHTYEPLAREYQGLGNYTAVYLVEHSALLESILEHLKHHRGLKTVGVGGYLKKYKCDLHLMDAGPCEFLGLIQHAEFVLATSFHAAVFALLFHKNFAIIPPKINAARIEQLLGYLALEKHIITDLSQMDQALEAIDYREVDPKLDLLRSESRQWLEETLAKVQKNRRKNDEIMD